MTRKEARIITILSVVAFIFAFLISGRLWFRLDLSRDKVNTISQISRNLHREIMDQVIITYFISDRLAQAHPLPGQIGDLLGEYAAHSRGKIRFIKRDPSRAGSSLRVEELGIAPQQIEVVESNVTTLATVYTGILIEYLDREAVIPVVFSLETLEYDLSSRIRSLLRNTSRELGVIVGDAHKHWNSDYGLLHRELVLSGFSPRLLSPGEEIPQALPAIFVLGGAEDLDPWALYCIDRYICTGGRALFALGGIVIDTENTLEARAARDRGLLAMLANYGAVLGRALVLDTNALNFTFQTQSGSMTEINTIRYPHWIAVQEQGGNQDHPLTGRFRGLDLYWASPLDLYPPPGVKGEVLFTTSPQAWLQSLEFITNPIHASRFAEEREFSQGTKILGAALSGIFPGAFEGLPKPSREGNWENNEGDPPVQKKPSRLIVVGNAGFAGPLMQVSRGEGRNLDFLIRAAEWLSNDDDIITIRGRQGMAGRLDRIQDREKRDAVMAVSRVINTILIPLAAALAGFFIVWRRRVKTSNARPKETEGQGDI